MQKKVLHTAGKRYMCLPCKANLSYTSKVEARKETILPQILLLFQPVLPVNVCGRNVMRMQKQKCRNPYELLAGGKVTSDVHGKQVNVPPCQTAFATFTTFATHCFYYVH